jgi:nucleotide-binding universal stress UspA family protein
MFSKLLVAIDDTASAPVALSFASALARGEGASLHVIHANRLVVGGRGFTELTDQEATALVDTAVLQLLEVGVDATGSVSRSTSYSIGQVIAEAARSRQCDAIVLGSRRPTRRTRLAHPFGRGTRERIIRYSALPVITAPAPLQVPGGRRRHGGNATHPVKYSEATVIR